MRLLPLLPALLVLALAGPAAAADDPARPVPGSNALVTSGPALLGTGLLDTLRCTGDVAGSPLTPVLLLHGTGSTGEESWGPVYLPQLTAGGRPACTVDLPARATGDMQVSSEVVVAAVREVARLRGGRVDVVGHSQGATLAVTALKYWPDLPGLVEDYVGLAPTFNVGVTGEAMCARPCSAPFQQRRAGSAYFAGVRSHPLPAGPSYTTIATLTDEIATPEPEASRLEGARNVVLQERCPAKVVDHFGLVTDGTVFALVLDGLSHAGPVEPARVPDAACLDALPPGSDPAAVAPLVAQAVANDLAANGSSEKLDAEPPVRCYVSAGCADVDDRGRLLRSASLSRVRAAAGRAGARRAHRDAGGRCRAGAGHAVRAARGGRLRGGGRPARGHDPPGALDDDRLLHGGGCRAGAAGRDLAGRGLAGRGLAGGGPGGLVAAHRRAPRGGGGAGPAPRPRPAPPPRLSRPRRTRPLLASWPGHPVRGDLARSDPRQDHHTRRTPRCAPLSVVISPAQTPAKITTLAGPHPARP